MSSRVSVVVPMHNAQSLIGETIESIVTQAGVEFELVIVDDGSTDGSLRVARQYLTRAKIRTRIVCQANSGEASAVNAGVGIASGDYIAIVNADDPLLPGHLHAMSHALDTDEKVVVAYCDWKIIDSSSKTVIHRRAPDYLWEHLYEDFYCVPGPGALVRKSAIKRGFLRNGSYQYVTDFESWLYLGTQGLFKRVPQCLATWRMHSLGATTHGRGPKIAGELLRLANEYESIVSSHFGAQSVRRMTSRANYLAGLQGLHSARVPARKHMIRSLALKPFPTLARKRIHRSPAGVLSVISLPISRYPYYLWARMKYGVRKEQTSSD